MENFDHEFMSALIDIESSNNPKAFNPETNARGLTQITPIAWQDLTVRYPERYSKLKFERDMFKPDVALQAGKDYLEILKGYLKHYGIPITMDNLIAGYNWGIGNLKEFGLENAPAETKKYIGKMRHLLQPQSEQLDADYK